LAGFDALAAADALVFIVQQHRMHADGFWIMAPGAVHITALEEDCATDARTVV